MDDLRNLDLGEVMLRAASALSRASGRTVKLDQGQPLSKSARRNLIVRGIAVEDDGEARPVIVKATRSAGYDPTAANALQASGLVREWVATAHLAAHAAGRDHGAALLAGDVEAGVLVFEDLGAGTGSLVDAMLHGTEAAAEQALTSYATALGRLHADTVGCLDAHHATFQSIFGGGRVLRAPGWRVEDEAKVVVDRIGHAPPASELALLSSRLADPGPWLSLVHGDPCPDNALLVGGRIRLIDYEWARVSHALLDGLYWKIGFPTCWCAGLTPADVAARLDAVYRAELGRAIPAAADEEAYRVEAAYMTVVWLFTCLSWRLGEALDGDERWGTWSIRGRLLWYLEAAIATTDAAGVLPGITRAARTWLAGLRDRWPDATPLGLYPAFVTQPQSSAM
jgi:hypothetical protein